MGVTAITTAKGWRGSVEAPDEEGPVEEYLGRFVTHLISAGRSPKTVERYQRAARQLGEWLAGTDVTKITRSDLEAYIALRRELTSPATAATDFVSLQQFFKYLTIEAKVPSPMRGMVPPRFVDPLIEVVPVEFLAALVRQCETYRPDGKGKDFTFEALRDTAILRIFIDTGCRLAEVTDLTLSQITEAPVLVVYGKSKGHGPVPRPVEIGEKAHRALRKYLRVRAAHPLASTGTLWLSDKGVLRAHGVRQMVKRRSARLGMHVHPHMLRHTKADSFLAAGGQEGDLMRLMGWRSDAMPKRYGAARAESRALEAQRKMGFVGDSI